MFCKEQESETEEKRGWTNGEFKVNKSKIKLRSEK